jgi:sigma-E factor negative regulatory protein RseB
MFQALVLTMTRSALALGCLALAIPSYADDTTVEARLLLERMTKAIASRNYEGRFFHTSPVRSETMQIIHRVSGGKVVERLVSLDGSGREIIRDETKVVCYLPDRRTVLVEQRAGDTSLLSGLPSYSEDLARLYSIDVAHAGKVLGRATQLVSVRPRDQFRYGYRLWLDSDSAMPLKSQLCDSQGAVIEQIAFGELTVRASIAEDRVKPGISTEGFRWIRQDPPGTSMPQIVTSWHVLQLPSGFKLTVQRVQILAGSAAPVQHMVFSDGLASVSVFIEPLPSDDQMRGLARVGSAFAFSRPVNGHQVTAVGEVPAATVEAIAESVSQDEVRNASGVVAPAETRH